MVWILIGAAFLACALLVAVQLPATAPRVQASEAEVAFADRVMAWSRRVTADLVRSESALAIVSRDTLREWEVTRPDGAVSDRARKELTAEDQHALGLHATDLRRLVTEHNGRVLRRALGARREFVRMIEQRPLAPEQAEAVAVVDNRVLVVAPAGTGKSSVLVARAAWAVRYGGFDPQEILVLAFDQAGADELQARVDARLDDVDIDPTGLRPTTFTSFALSVVARATGDRPRLAPWLDSGRDVNMVVRIAEQLRESDASFGRRWDLYRLLLARVGDEAGPYTTMRGETVESQGELLLADWLFLHGVEQHGVELAGAADAPLLVESPETFAVDGFGRLEERLAQLGVPLDWDPGRATAAEHVPHLQHEDLAQILRTFMTHVKSRGLTREHLDAAWARAGGTYRDQLFLALYWPVHEAWQQRLGADESIDAEDLLLQAASHLESGTDTGVRMVLVDDFQDVTPARARLLRALVAEPHRYLLAVGDDWQAIRRNDGGDVSVMADFERWFGEGRSMNLQTTFRSSRLVAETAAEFVQQNPRQIRKQLRPHRTDPGSPVQLVRLGDESELTGTVAAWLDELSLAVPSATVLVLGRHAFEQSFVPHQVPSNLTVTFRTMHGAKGVEADHVLVPRMLTGRYGFPTAVADDPVLGLLTARTDPFPHGDERRLFYVALTRARRSVTLVTVRGQESPFVTELMERGRVTDSPLSTADDVVPCPGCGRGFLVPRNGAYGGYLGCSRFPQCRHTEQRPARTPPARGARPGDWAPGR